jgi:trk system potassium uptake protein
MRIMIIGAGSAGAQLARRLCEERHDVVVVDQLSAPLEELEDNLDIMTVTGPGSSPATLAQAEIEKADLVVAVTSRDEVNILACLFAHAAGVRHKVARISNTDYIHETAPFDLRQLGIDLVVSQKEECAHDLFNVLRLPGTIEVVDVLNQKAIVVGIKIDIDSPLAMTFLGQFPNPELINQIRFIAFQRNNKLTLPRGDTQFMIGDDVYMVGQPDAITNFLQWAYPERPRFRKFIIAGGGDLGFHLAGLLETLHVETILLEPDTQRAEYCADRLERTLVLKSDPLDPDTFEDIGITADTAFVAAMEDDENNIICCLLAEKKGASFTAAQVAKTGYAPIINSLSLLDRAVNPYTSMINAISRFIRGTHIEAAATLYSLPGEMIEVRLPVDSPWVGKTIEQIGNLREGIIAAVLRGDDVIPATGSLALLADDQITLFTLPNAARKMLAQLRGE